MSKCRVPVRKSAAGQRKQLLQRKFGMNTGYVPSGADIGSSLWIESLPDGLAGITMKAKSAIYCGASPFQKIEVFDTYAFGRVLMLGGSLVFTQRDEHIYNEMITHPALIAHPAPKRICVIGGGDGGCAREIAKHPEVERIVVVEIDEMVTKVVEQFFPQLSAGLNEPRVEIQYDDGMLWLEKHEDLFDIIIVDSYDPGGPVQSLETGNFYELLRSRMAPGGMAVLQMDSPPLRVEHIRRSTLVLSAMFSASHAYCCTIPSFPNGLSSFLLCPTDPTSGSTPLKRLSAIEALCRYFGREVHRGSFLLPREIRGIFGDSAEGVPSWV
jgi:spermidine synthase